MENIKENAKETVKEIFKNNNIDNYEREFIEELIESLDLVVSSEDVGDSVEYYDEDGVVLFIISNIDEEMCEFNFYENSYKVPIEVLEKFLEAMESED